MAHSDVQYGPQKLIGVNDKESALLRVD